MSNTNEWPVKNELPELTCRKCGHVWHPRVEITRMCPACKSVTWNDAPKARAAKGDKMPSSK